MASDAVTRSDQYAPGSRGNDGGQPGGPAPADAERTGGQGPDDDAGQADHEQGQDQPVPAARGVQGPRPPAEQRPLQAVAGPSQVGPGGVQVERVPGHGVVVWPSRPVPRGQLDAGVVLLDELRRLAVGARLDQAQRVRAPVAGHVADDQGEQEQGAEEGPPHDARPPVRGVVGPPDGCVGVVLRTSASARAPIPALDHLRTIGGSPGSVSEPQETPAGDRRGV